MCHGREPPVGSGPDILSQVRDSAVTISQDPTRSPVVGGDGSGVGKQEDGLEGPGDTPRHRMPSRAAPDLVANPTTIGIGVDVGTQDCEPAMTGGARGRTIVFRSRGTPCREGGHPGGARVVAWGGWVTHSDLPTPNAHHLHLRGQVGSAGPLRTGDAAPGASGRRERSGSRARQGRPREVRTISSMPATGPAEHPATSPVGTGWPGHVAYDRSPADRIKPDRRF